MAHDIALVTGGAGGIGRSVVEACLEEGKFVAVCDRSEAQLEQCAEDFSQNSDRLAFFQLDVSKANESQNLVAQISEKFGPIRSAVLAAGIARKTSFLEHSVADWQDTINVNLCGSFYMLQALAKDACDKQYSASYVLVSSICGERADPFSFHVAYEASKGGVNQLVRASAIELAPFGIRVNAVAPGRIETALTNSDPKHQATVKSRIPMNRYGSAREVAQLIRFLNSDDASYITGSIYSVDGGWLAT